MTFCEIFPPDDFPLYFYRYPTAPDLMIEPRELPLDAIRDAPGLLGHGHRPVAGAEPRGALRRLGGPGRRQHTVLDLDYRPMFWPDPAEASEQVGRALEHVTVAVGNREECEVAVGETDPQRAADALLERGVELAIVKQGPKGVLAATRDERVEVRALPGRGRQRPRRRRRVRRRARATGCSSGWDLRRILEFANVAGAIVASRLECSRRCPPRPRSRPPSPAPADRRTMDR